MTIKPFNDKVVSSNLTTRFFFLFSLTLSSYLRKITIIFLSISSNICFGCSKDLSHRDNSFEHPQHMFWLRNKKNNFQLRTLIWGPEYYFILILSKAKPNAILLLHQRLKYKKYHAIHLLLKVYSCRTIRCFKLTQIMK